jgi:ribonuclease Z|tara:strand:+ start:27719 stop:28630 length:912 start_codon:yes stop_codon:yes gene_type:complete
VSFYVQFLGTGSALPTVNHHPTSQYIFCQNRHFLIDCGEGTQIQLRKRSVKIQKLDAIFISHMHGDHYFGLVGLLSSMHLLGREKSISIYGPEVLETIVRMQLELGGASLNFEVVFHAIADKFEGLLFEDKVLEIKTFKLKHKIPTHGFVFKEKVKERHLIAAKFKESGLSLLQIPDLKAGKDVTDEQGKVHSFKTYTKKPKPSSSYAFCSDTTYSESILPWINGVDVLYHEATFTNKDKARAKATLHSTAEQAAKIARMAKVGKLYFGHLSARYDDAEVHLKEAKVHFENCFEAVEGEIVKL